MGKKGLTLAQKKMAVLRLELEGVKTTEKLALKKLKMAKATYYRARHWARGLIAAFAEAGINLLVVDEGEEASDNG